VAPAFLIGAATLLAAAASPSQPAPATRDTAYVVSFDTTYYITNRSRSGNGLGGRRSDSFEYGFVVTRFRERVAVPDEARWTAGFSSRQADPVSLTRDEFIAHVKAIDARATARNDGPVVYVHGFAVSFRRAIAQGSEIAHRGRFGGALIVFAWPAHHALATWPRPSAILTRAYRDDLASAAASAAAFRAALGDLLDAVPAGRVTVAGHSLGARLATEALAAPSWLRDSLSRTPLGALALFAPDISAAHFRDSLDAPLVPLAARRMIYASRADRMLMLSRLFNRNSRAGQVGGQRLLAAADIEFIDVTDGRRADGALRKLVEPRHAMRYASSALRDFFGVVRGATGDCRVSDGLAEQTGPRSWRLTAATVPAHDVACSAAVSSARR
jgi:esterase/lipase superfamily enzyme